MSRVPRIRFKGFEEDWEQRKLSEIYKNICNAYVGTATPYYVEDGHFYLEANNVKDGKINYNSQIFINDNFYESQKDKWLTSGDIVMVQSGHVGHAAVIPEELENTVAHALIIFKNAKIKIEPYFLNYQYQTLNFKRKIENITVGNTIKHILASDMKECMVYVSRFAEQIIVSKYFQTLDHLITLHQRKLEKLKIIKKSMLENLFPQNGEKTPKIRFSGFTEDWEQRKLGEVVVIERGGSPRPIEKYVTESNDGLNWIKIGDAPVQGRYITKTSEKIKESGLSKTRQVFPGDLILSNSMSFGKPYIMGIEGCIHDGWLVIKNRNNVFDLKFLCHMLSTEYLFNQYKMFAAGSTVNNLNKELVGNASVRFPKMLEQRKIGQYLESLDHLITLYQSKLEKLQKIKKSMLESMFV